MGSITLFEGIILLVISGAGGIGWWGIRRLVKMSDDGAKLITNVNTSLSLICERLGKSEMWMELHEKSDDERHGELKKAQQAIINAVIDKRGIPVTE